jgi:hypothetical protein
LIYEKYYKLFYFTNFIYSCSEKIEYKELASEKAKEMNCMADIELLVKNDNVELWASYSQSEEGLLCVYTCKNDICYYSTERD